MRRRVLLISYYAPPYGGPQGFRIAQFMRHLPSNGWEPVLLTVPAAAYGSGADMIDESSFDGLRMRRIVTPAISLARPATVLKGTTEPGRNRTPPALPRQAILNLASILASPDQHIAWLPQAVTAGVRAAGDCDLIYAAGPPFTNHVVGACIARLSRKPLVVMVDDPWVSMTHRIWRNRVQRSVQACQERFIMRSATAVLAGTPGFRRDLVDRHGDELGQRTHVVRWGFEEDDYDSQVSPPETPPTRLVYTGSLRGAHYDPIHLFRGVARAIDDDPALRDRIVLDVYGKADQAYRDLVPKLGLTGVVAFHGFRPRAEIVQATQRSHCGVLLINDTHPELAWYESAKLFHYAGARRPVLGVVPLAGDAAQLIRERNLGLVVSPRDETGIAAAVKEITHSHRGLRTAISECGDLGSRTMIASVGGVFDRVADPAC